MNDEKNLKKAVGLAKSKFYKNKLQQKKLTRKDIRKNKRLEKKNKQNEFQKKKAGVVESKPVEVEKKKKKRKRKLNQSKDSTDDVDDYKKATFDAAKQKDEQVINKLGKKLRITKKSKLPSIFKDDGLDYLLEVCEPLTEDFKGNDSDEEYLKEKTKQSKNIEKKAKSQANLYGEDIEDDEQTISEKLLFDDGEDDPINDESGDEIDDDEYLNNEMEDDEIGSDVEIIQDENDVDDDISDVEDKNDDDSGKEKDVDNQDVGGKYIPPALRKLPKTDVDKEKLKIERIKKQLKGLLNRVSEPTLPSIVSDIEALYLKNSRNTMNELLYELISEACVTSSKISERLLMEHMVIIAILHISVGMEVGSYFLEMLVEKLESLHSLDETKKDVHNVLFMIVSLYNFKVVHCSLVYDIIRNLLQRFQEIDIELILLILKACGSEIRKDDPASLKETILEAQAKAVTSELKNQSRVRFMLEIINALKNNNMRKIPQYDPTLLENMKKCFKQLKHGKDSVGSGIQLKVSLEDLLSVKTKGRWWIVGSAWSGRGPSQNENKKSESHSLKEEENLDMSSQLLAIAKKQHMNTTLRKTIFCAMMTSEDYADAFEKLLKLNLPEKQSREIIHVLIECCLQEKQYNPFYAHLSEKLCEYSKSNQITLQYTIWDRFKILSSQSQNSNNNLCRILAHLIASKSLSLSLLKVVSFGVLEKRSIKFFINFFKTLLMEYPETVVTKSFKRLSNQPKLSLLREGIKIFLRHFLLPNKTEEIDIQNTHMIELIEKCESAIDGRDYVPL